MVATLNFIANGFTISGSSGLGLFGSAFGNSVKVGQYQDNTYITDGNGTNQGPATNNVKYFNGVSGYIGNNTVPSSILCVPNYQATLNIRFNNDTAVKTQNGKVYIYDRVNTANVASGVLTAIAEVVHPDTIQNNTGSGNSTWTLLSGVAGQTLNSINLYGSPGVSGIYNNTASVRPDTQHDSYLIISASPITVGSKTQYGLFCSLEYL